MKVKIERKYWVLLVLDAADENHHSPVQLQKSLFLIGEKLKIKSEFFVFAPYDYGPFDADIYKDAEELEKEGLITIAYEPNLRWKVYAIKLQGARIAEEIKKKLDDSIVKEISNNVNWVIEKSFRELVKQIYIDYPEFSTNSVFRG